MIRSDPLLLESLAGVAHPQRAYQAQIGYLLLQAFVLVSFWPKSGLLQLVARGEEPDALLALLICLGMTLAYAAMREGAEELMGAERVSMREWAASTPLALGRIVSGQLFAQLVQSFYALFLSAPLIAIAYVVSASGPWPVLMSILTAVVQALVYRLIVASMFLSIGHRRELMFYMSRTVLVVSYGLGLYFQSSFSHAALTHSLLRTGSGLQPIGFWHGAMPGTFLLVYGAMVVLLWLRLVAQLKPYRQSQ